MHKKFCLAYLLPILLLLGSCSKKEVAVPVLQDSYEPQVGEAEFTGQDFIVSLNASALQDGERGEWKIIRGPVVEEYVYIENKQHPFSKFKGMPGETYTLEWKHIARDGSARTVQSNVSIPPL